MLSKIKYFIKNSKLCQKLNILLKIQNDVKIEHFLKNIL